MSDECKCGFDHWPMPCRDEKPANERAASSLAAPAGSTAQIAPGSWVKDLRDTRWKVWGTNRQGMALLYQPNGGAVYVQHVNSLTKVEAP